MTLDLSISQLPAGVSPNGAEILPVVQAGQTVHLTVDQLANLIAGNPNIDALLTALMGQLTVAQLAASLASPIELITADSTVAGSVAQQVKTETDARVAALAAEAGYRSTGDTTTLGSAQTYTQTWAYSKAAVDSAIAAEGSSLTTAFQAGDSATLTAANTSLTSYAYSKSAVDSAIAAAQTALTTAYQAADAATLSTAESYTYSQSQINSAIAGSASTLTTNFTSADAATLASAKSYTYSQSAIDSAIANSASAVTAAYQAADSATLASAQNYTYSQAQINSAISTAITNVSATLNGNITSAVQTEATARANTDNGLLAQYTIKVDANGHIAGIGLASTVNNGVPSSAVVIRADSFEIIDPSASTSGLPAISPFFVQASPTTIGGESVAAGVYMSTAFVQNGSFGTIKLANQAVTIPVAVRNPSSTTVSASATTLVSMTFTSTGAPVIITGGVRIGYNMAANQNLTTFTLQLYRGSTLLASQEVPFGPNGTVNGSSFANTFYQSAVLVPYVDTPGAGTWTYTLQIAGSGMTAQPGATLCGLEVKK